MQDAADGKAASRKAAAARRDRAHLDGGPLASREVCERVSHVIAQRFGAALGAVILAGYRPIRSEIDPTAAMTAHPGPVCVPVVEKLHHPLEFHRWTPNAPMRSGRYGAEVPAQHDPLTPQVLLVPLLAFDTGGYRLGYGGGFYDRTLQLLRARGPVWAIGLAYAAQAAAQVPTEPTDERLDLIITERGLVVPQ